MRLSSLNIFPSFKSRRAQQEREVKENSSHPKKIWDMRQHRGWGNSIQWFDVETARLNGWTTPLPKKGDELLCEMKSGRIGRFQFTNIEPCVDPSDMWFGNVKQIGYSEEV